MAYTSTFYEGSGYYGKASLTEAIVNPGIRAKFDTLFTHMCHTTGVRFRRSLDIGCGASPFSLRLTCNQRIIIDVSFIALRSARGPERVQGDLQHLPFRSESFHVVIGADVLEHVPHDDCATVEIHRVSTARGTLALTVPHRPDLWSSSDIYEGHFRRYSLEVLQDLLVMAGFDVLGVFKVYGVYWIMRAVQARDRKRLLQRKGHFGGHLSQVPIALKSKSAAEFILSDVMNVLRTLTRNRYFFAFFNPLSKFASRLIMLDARLLPLNLTCEIGVLAQKM